MSPYNKPELTPPKGKEEMAPVATVLVVDDEWDIRELLSDIITDVGLRVIQAGNGAEALQRAQTDLPDLIMLDVWMPGFTGFQVLEKLRENQSTRHIPVVLLTAMPPVQGEKEGLNSGVTHYIHKPWEAGVVEATVRVVLRESVALKNGSGAAGLDSGGDASDNREDGFKQAEEGVVELPVASQPAEERVAELPVASQPEFRPSFSP